MKKTQIFRLIPYFSREPKVLDLIYQETTLLQMKKEDKSEISSSLSSPVPRAGIEPARL